MKHGGNKIKDRSEKLVSSDPMGMVATFVLDRLRELIEAN